MKIYLEKVKCHRQKKTGSRDGLPRKITERSNERVKLMSQPIIPSR